jgi:hypothetical protein
MRFPIGRALALSLLTAAAVSAQAGKSVAWKDVVGTWNGRSLRTNSDSVITAITFRFGADRKVTVKYPNRAAMVGRVIVTGGDSIVVDYGPYESLTRSGHTVASVHNILHFSGHEMRGAFIAKFDDGQTLNGRLDAKHAR